MDFYEVTFRWTIPHMMEELLNADPRVREKIGGKTVRVINAGVPGYVYQNSLMRYLAKLRLYKPDLLVAVDGANDIHTVARTFSKEWNYFTEGPYYEHIIDIMDMRSQGAYQLFGTVAEEKHLLLHLPCAPQGRGARGPRREPWNPESF